MTVLEGEGTTLILFGSTNVSTGAAGFGGYLARPDLRGEWPTVLLVAPSKGADSSIRAICRLLARNGMAAVAPERGGIAPFADFITNPAGFWSNAEDGYGVIGFGDGAWAAVTQAVNEPVASLALVGGEFGDGVAEALVSVTCPVLGCAGKEGLDGLDEIRGAAPHAEWVLYGGVGPDYWNIDAEGFSPKGAEDTGARTVEFFANTLPAKR